MEFNKTPPYLSCAGDRGTTGAVQLCLRPKKYLCNAAICVSPKEVPYQGET